VQPSPKAKKTVELKGVEMKGVDLKAVEAKPEAKPADQPRAKPVRTVEAATPIPPSEVTPIVESVDASHPFRSASRVRGS
jgi:hypothetical protein